MSEERSPSWMRHRFMQLPAGANADLLLGVKPARTKGAMKGKATSLAGPSKSVPGVHYDRRSLMVNFQVPPIINLSVTTAVHQQPKK